MTRLITVRTCIDMQKRTCNSQALIDLEGKTIRNVHLSGSHGDVFEICFEDGTNLKLMTTRGITDKQVEENPNDLYITLKDNPLFQYGPIQ